MKTLVQTSQGKMKLRPNVAKFVEAFDKKERTRLIIDQIPYTAHVTVVEVDSSTGEMSSLSLRNLERIKPQVYNKRPKKAGYNPIKTQGTERTREQLQPSRKIATK